ncbi:MAG TPA: alkaline phosphatase family protein [Gemmatimonadaceae bacterium]|nr:alkaline phosphatase family protein [Gemmatimonadaceae bacterium]
MSRLLFGMALLAAGAASCQAQTGARGTPADPPTLVVLIAVDQMRADYLDRFGPQLTGGLARLMRDGARFTNAHQDHGWTLTAPGHASMLSGRFPRSTGIVSNSLGVGDPRSPLLDGAGGDGASPHRFVGTTLVDWLHGRDRRSRALAVAGKDRGAILPVGRSRANVYWYDPVGRFTTSTYYADSLPDWIRRFNATRSARRYAAQRWDLLLPDSAYAEPDSVVLEGHGRDFAFPHWIPTDSAQAADYVQATPRLDEIVLEFALEGLNALGIGRGPQTDVLSVSLSATDYIGHRYGPDSREIHDQMLQLDRALGMFLDSLYRLRAADRVALVFTADHGVSPIPEIVSDSVRPRPTHVDLSTLLEQMSIAMRAAGANPQALLVSPPLVALDRQLLGRSRISADSIINLFAARAREVPGILRVDRWRALQKADTIRDVIARRWLHHFSPQSRFELVMTVTPGSMWGSDIATHGSPHDQDSHVPLIFYGPWFRTGSHDEFVRTVDIAPTLARVLGVRPSEPLDGVVLEPALQSP